MTVWKTIDSAPKDGRPFLAFAPGYSWPEICCWFDYDEASAAEAGAYGYFHYADQLFQEMCPEFDFSEITHWTELPPPPDNTDV